eukprot:g2463.t1
MKRSKTWEGSGTGASMMAASAGTVAALRHIGVIKELHWPKVPTLSEVAEKLTNWLKDKGPNGGVLPNGAVLFLVAMQLLAWSKAEKISRGIAGALSMPRGKRRPAATSLYCRIVGWLVENGAVITLCNLRSLLPHPEPIPDVLVKASLRVAFLKTLKTLVSNMLISIVSNMIAEEGAVFLHHLASTRIYGNFPYFVEQRRSANPTSSLALKDWTRGNAILQIIGGGVFLGFIECLLPKEAAEEIEKTPFNFWKFLRNFAIFRVVADITFYTAHRCLHRVPWLYRNVHKRHHEHYTTNLTTNFHFTAADLFLESALPLIVGLGFLRSIGIKMGRYELHLILTYVAWHETGTHLGKPLPTISTYPPLSILYTAFTNWERDSIEFHEVHHNRRHCNYGITQWIDHLMGSRRLKASPHD